MAVFLSSIDISSIASSFSSTGNFPHELTIKHSICHSKDLVEFFFFFPVRKLLCKCISNRFDPFIIQCKWNCFDWSNIGSNCDLLFTTRRRWATLEPDAAFFPQIMRPVITILIGINKKWVMAQGTFANSTQRMEYQGIKHTWEGSYNLMKIQLAHLRNGLCTRNKISQIRKIRA